MFFKHSINCYKPITNDTLVKGTLESRNFDVTNINKACLRMDCLAKELVVYIIERRSRLSQARGNGIGFCSLRGKPFQLEQCPRTSQTALIDSEFPITRGKQAVVWYAIFLKREALKFIPFKIFPAIKYKLYDYIFCVL